MAHRSNQVIASQDRELTHPDPAPAMPPARRVLVSWATALAALGASTVLLGVGVWFVRYSIAEFILGAALAERGAEADFRVVNLDLGGVTLRDVRFGSENSPDAAIPIVEIRWDWSGLSPRVRSLRLIEPRVRVRIDQGGRISAGALDRIGGAPGRRRPSVPLLELQIVNGAAVIEAPFGALEASLQSSGTIGRDFIARARIADATRPGADYALESGEGELVIVSRDETLRFQFGAEADGLVWDGARFGAVNMRAAGSAPLDLSRYEAEAALQAQSIRAEDVSATAFAGAVSLNADAQDDALAFGDWRAAARVTSDAMQLGQNTMRSARFELGAQGEGSAGRAQWTLAGSRFEGLALVSERPSALGVFAFDAGADQSYSGQARVLLEDSRLDPEAQDDLRAAFPELNGTPVGPTFERAERALDAAADRFDLVIPLALDAVGDDPRLRIVESVDARASTGARLHLAPLRQDAPALVLQWPGPTLNGAVSVELVGGGAPHATLLLDTVNWRPQAPFEADGTLTLANWTAGGASIAADELGITVAVPQADRGRIDLRGPARITGPVGDGEVRNFSTALDIAITWDAGWRVTPNRGCLPTRLGGIDVAGLSFANGAFSLCALGDALIAADARDNLSGGFIIRSLALNGRLSGVTARPARLTANSLAGRFSGRTGDVALALEADAPGLSVDMADDRTLSIALRRITGQARIGEGWSVVGAFEQGALSDPTLPGSVSAIEGGWSARSEDGDVVLRVDAGQALLTANRPASDAERPLFHALELVGVDATLRQGRLDARGAILLEATRRQLAEFTAFHDVDDGVGGAEIVAPEIVFGETLQPYQISERARGLIENVRGPTSLHANIAWTDAGVDAVDRLELAGVSAATSTIPIIENVRGEILFDDLFALTTPPGQQVSVGLVNPGVAVTDGLVRFQLLSENDTPHVSLERAEFAFAGGVLAIAPTTIALGAPETRFELTLADVDAADLIATLSIPDLSATGRVEGSFPLLLTRRTALIEDGVLRSLPGGGVISYSGDAGRSFTGAARIAFDALRGFRYDSLVLRLNGDLNGEVVSSIEFSGENTGRPVDLGPIAPVPGVGNVSVRGVPFVFHVRITAPFRGLARTAALIADPEVILNPTEEPAEEVDPEAQSPR